jgi:quercetin dioxygenase-like cupin family protein
MNDTDPTTTNPNLYRTLWENDDVRVLEYRDQPGQETTPHTHPNTVMITLTDFERRLTIADQSRNVALAAGSAVWLPAQTHAGRNIGDTPTHTILVELKHSIQPAPADAVGPAI